MDNFFKGVLERLSASLIVYLTSKLFKKVKSHSNTTKSDFDFKLTIKFKRNKH
ncbi:TPA: hypothetical protein KOS69_002288 [Clostridioides difficile]|uniref:type I toxin-antitoxin system toxin n=1 Tax=Clostridioides difficile TaxID=1496 RepID=UPI00093A0EE4|nr:hypothetical protein [Clostridioides difficile]MBH7847330.1 hypothetical protein [Clostridioides difficile]MBY1606462.1 hypothetical protein [Clostridioides difficile]MBY1715487.1 hypothetical protein [Clostridioides difficile]MBZ0643402.1 hypothetical protein [Clostridioides difficile]MBZ0648232.1 hypothetical protein [Clostridioides difficile]